MTQFTYTIKTQLGDVYTSDYETAQKFFRECKYGGGNHLGETLIINNITGDIES